MLARNLGERFIVTFTGLSKTDYCYFRKCPRLLWISKHAPEVREITVDSARRAETGNEVGRLARGLFPGYVDVSVQDSDGHPDIAAMIAATEGTLEDGTRTICEASFEYHGLYCAVDALEPVDNGWEINEAKSTTESDKQSYYDDVAYQKYVLEHCGVKVVGTNLICIDHGYVLEDELDIEKLFSIDDISDEVEKAYAEVAENAAAAIRCLEQAGEPEMVFCEACKDCDCRKHCFSQLPSPNVYDLYGDSGFSYKRKAQLANEGKVAFTDLDGMFEGNGKGKRIRRQQVAHQLNDLPAYVDSEGIGNFVKAAGPGPWYVLDFETVQHAVSRYSGTHPYEQIPFQYSLHIMETDGSLSHREFLAEAGSDPRREIAEALVRDIPANVVVFAYNAKFEKGCLARLADNFPELAEHLMSIHENMLDLLDAFSAGFYYDKAMGGSFSIKSVLPALFPDAEWADYANLEGDVHNGTQAMAAFCAMEKMGDEELVKTRESLLRYCEPDTYALVGVWQRLNEACGNDTRWISEA